MSFGDVITLKNGNEIKGKVISEQGPNYVIRVGKGNLTVSRSDVANIERREEPKEPAAAATSAIQPVGTPTSEQRPASDQKLTATEQSKQIDALLATFDGTDAAACDAAEAELLKMGEEIVPYLFDKSNSVSADELRCILRVLCKLAPAESVYEIIKAASHEDRFVREQAVALVGELKDPRGFDALVKALKDRKDLVRLGAATSLAQLGDVKAVPYIIPLLADIRPDVVEAARQALVKLAGSDVGSEKSDWESWWRTKSQSMK